MPGNENGLDPDNGQCDERPHRGPAGDVQPNDDDVDPRKRAANPRRMWKIDHQLARLNRKTAQQPIALISGLDERISMNTTLTGTVDSREQADMVVERLVQGNRYRAHRYFRGCIRYGKQRGQPGRWRRWQTVDQDERGDVPLSGGVTASIDSQDEAKVEVVTAPLEEFGAEI